MSCGSGAWREVDGSSDQSSRDTQQHHHRRWVCARRGALAPDELEQDNFRLKDWASFRSTSGKSHYGDPATSDSSLAGKSYWSQSGSCFHDSVSQPEAPRLQPCEQQPHEDVAVCYRPLQPLKYPQYKDAPLAPSWWACIGTSPCPSLCCSLYQRDQLILLVPQAIYTKMVAWGFDELVSISERRVKMRGSIVGISTSDAVSAYLTKLCVLTMAMVTVYASAAVAMAYLVIGEPPSVPRALFLALALLTNFGPYLLALRHRFGAIYILWCVGQIIELAIAVMVLVEAVMLLQDVGVSLTLDLSALQNSPPFLAAQPADKTVVAVAIVSFGLAAACVCLNLAASYVLRKVNNLEESLIRVVTIYEKGHKRLNAAPFELWAAGLYTATSSSHRPSLA